MGAVSVAIWLAASSTPQLWQDSRGAVKMWLHAGDVRRVGVVDRVVRDGAPPDGGVMKK